MFFKSNEPGADDKEDNAPCDHVFAEYGGASYLVVYGNGCQCDDWNV